AETHQCSKVPQRLLRLFALYENLLNFVMPMCSQLPRPNPETPIVTSTNIVDVSGVGLKQFWNLKGHMQDASVLATAHYPETLERIFVSTSMTRRFVPVLTERRLLVPHLSFPQFGVGSNAGLTLSPSPRYS